MLIICYVDTLLQCKECKSIYIHTYIPTLLEDSFTKHVRMVGTEGSLLLVDKNMDQYEKTSFLSMACRSEYRH